MVSWWPGNAFVAPLGFWQRGLPSYWVGHVWTEDMGATGGVLTYLDVIPLALSRPRCIFWITDIFLSLFHVSCIDWIPASRAWLCKYPSAFTFWLVPCHGSGPVSFVHITAISWLPDPRLD